jgi:acid stress-induced BolA-like protein IbaG/YrbA
MEQQNKLTKEGLEKILTKRLLLKDPEYHLRKIGGRLVGNIISPTFRRVPDHKRQEMIWKALTDALRSDSVRMVGMLLAYSPEEWNPEYGTESSKQAKGKEAARAYGRQD